jgi:hypothetical protein
MELGGRLRNKLFVKKDVKTTAYKEPNNQETGITTLKKISIFIRAHFRYIAASSSERVTS